MWDFVNEKTYFSQNIDWKQRRNFNTKFLYLNCALKEVEAICHLKIQPSLDPASVIGISWKKNKLTPPMKFLWAAENLKRIGFLNICQVFILMQDILIINALQSINHLQTCHIIVPLEQVRILITSQNNLLSLVKFSLSFR